MLQSYENIEEKANRFLSENLIKKIFVLGGKCYNVFALYRYGKIRELETSNQNTKKEFTLKKGLKVIIIT